MSNLSISAYFFQDIYIKFLKKIEEIENFDIFYQVQLKSCCQACPKGPFLAYIGILQTQPISFSWFLPHGWIKSLFTIFFGQKKWYRGSPDSTNFAHPGNRTIEKIVLNGDLFSTKITIYDFWIFKVPFFSYLILKKVWECTNFIRFWNSLITQ